LNSTQRRVTAPGRFSAKATSANKDIGVEYDWSNATENGSRCPPGTTAQVRITEAQWLTMAKFAKRPKYGNYWLAMAHFADRSEYVNPGLAKAKNVNLTQNPNPSRN
jgi:hypothetical protein